MNREIRQRTHAARHRHRRPIGHSVLVHQDRRGVRADRDERVVVGHATNLAVIVVALAVLVRRAVLSAGFGIEGFLLSSHFIDGGVTGERVVFTRRRSRDRGSGPSPPGPRRWDGAGRTGGDDAEHRGQVVQAANLCIRQALRFPDLAGGVEPDRSQTGLLRPGDVLRIETPGGGGYG